MSQPLDSFAAFAGTVMVSSSSGLVVHHSKGDEPLSVKERVQDGSQWYNPDVDVGERVHVPQSEREREREREIL